MKYVIGFIVIFLSWLLISYGSPLYVEAKELPFLEQMQSGRSWLGFFLIMIAFWMRMGLGAYWKD